jgi:hypothetical protein
MSSARNLVRSFIALKLVHAQGVLWGRFFVHFNFYPRNHFFVFFKQFPNLNLPEFVGNLSLLFVENIIYNILNIFRGKFRGKLIFRGKNVRKIGPILAEFLHNGRLFTLGSFFENYKIWKFFFPPSKLCINLYKMGWETFWAIFLNISGQPACMCTFGTVIQTYL